MATPPQPRQRQRCLMNHGCDVIPYPDGWNARSNPGQPLTG